MSSAILVHPNFDAVYPWAADHAHRLWSAQGDVEFMRMEPQDTRPAGEVLADAGRVTRLLALGVPVTSGCLEALTRLREVGVDEASSELSRGTQERGIRLITQPSQGFWGQSVAEFGLALTLCGLRRIPQLHQAMTARPEVWKYGPPDGIGRPGTRGVQFGDDVRFTNGTIEGKRIRIVGAGNIASRYASFTTMMGADVVAWDPFAAEPCFHRAGARREYFLERLVQDAEIFAPMLPLTEKTAGLVTAAHINALPTGCLVLLVTRAEICDTQALRRRVLNDELSLAADVFDIEPLPLDDPLLGRHNVVHTPHNAGRTLHTNESYAQALLDQFEPVQLNKIP